MQLHYRFQKFGVNKICINLIIYFLIYLMEEKHTFIHGSIKSNKSDSKDILYNVKNKYISNKYCK